MEDTVKHKAGVFFLLFVLLGACSTTFAEQSITPQDAGKFFGKSVVVCGKVVGVQYVRRWMGRPTYLHFEGQSPAFFAVIMELDAAKFGAPLEELYEGKEICVSGFILRSKSKFQINVREPSQILIKD